MTSLIEKYFTLKDALVDSDLSKTKSTGNQLISSLKQIDMKLLEGDAHHKWMEIENTLSSSLKSLTETEDIEEARKYFEDISEAAIESADFFGVNREIVYVQFCPMAFDDKGASWLSDSDEILNPYFGDMMLNCGEVTKKISAVDSYMESDDKSAQPVEHQH
ncbi:MAG: DUF3347 domain-containing protein [Melioribacteraceae bacterium]|nr:DUF3347 domain-containing protein [Melioribacteraceae bacterium]